MVFHRSLSDSKSRQISRTLSILAVLNNAVIWMVSTRPPTSKSSSPFSNLLNAPITIGIIVTCMFHSFFNSLARSRYLSFFSYSLFFFCGQPGQQSRLFSNIIIIIIIIIVASFSHKRWLIVFFSNLGDCKSSPGPFLVFWPISTIL